MKNVLFVFDEHCNVDFSFFFHWNHLATVYAFNKNQSTIQAFLINLEEFKN